VAEARLSRNRRKIRIVPNAPPASGERVLIKLPRRILHTCTPARISEAFSYPEDLTAREAIIWCDDDDRTITHAFMGVVEKISTRGARKWALRVIEAFDPAKVDRRALYLEAA
jgi:hypothetical protein